MPDLCDYHHATVTAMESHGHIDTEHAERAAQDIAKQCKDCSQEDT